MNVKAEKLSLQRLGLMIKRDLLSGYTTPLIVLAAGISVQLLVDLMMLWQGNIQSGHHTEMFAPLLLIGGFIFTSTSFKELHRKETNQNYLLIPASPLEKVLAGLLRSSLGWVIFVALWYGVFTLISLAFGELILGRHFPLTSPLNRRMLEVYANYLVLQSLFLVGAVYFRKNNFFKTIFSMFLFMIVFSVVIVFFFRIVFASYFEGFMMIEENTLFGPMMEIFLYRNEGLFKFLEGLSKVVYWGLAAPIAWILTYVRFREVQVKDGI